MVPRVVTEHTHTEVCKYVGTSARDAGTMAPARLGHWTHFYDDALKCIFGPGISGRQMRAMAQIQTLRKRREDLCDKFANKCLNDPRMEHWFQRKTTRTSARRGGGGEVFVEEKARCDRLVNSPFFYFRRRLNGKVGKTYGSRNAEYRTDAS